MTVNSSAPQAPPARADSGRWSVAEPPEATAGTRSTLPFVVPAGTPGTPVAEFLPDARPFIRRRLRKHGAVLLRGFDIGGVEGFEDVVRAVSGEPLAYAERSSPRSTIKGQVYTSTDYPPSEEIFLHNENSYQATWPMTLFFYCVRPPETLGSTPLADTRRVLRAIDPAVREEFAARGWMVVRNFIEGFGVPWQQAFNTDDRDEVARYCARNGVEVEWTGADGLRTRARRKAVHTHPVTGEEVWFNHLSFFHVTTLAEEICSGLREMFAEDELPTNTFYGDGERIPDDIVAHLRSCYRAELRRFDWQRDDVLLVDNMLASHAREPFTGPRKIAVAMAEPSDAFSPSDAVAAPDAVSAPA
ncbi:MULTISPECIES: TauD/TfdA family dioxygenase [unclassified Streptomyces]|uniref:TauD/TfdA family dioxygenase n=1 Tax=unclassified Streptomyces TaxID=2593676 RepID=UPI00081F3A51|nr:MULTISPECIES: TauD/TfdA family dioxygenase [unclassified Streptomyces]MYZ33699.1 TauD/TfdA family dioxygenase [Streptomyces sp. SID4917]SCF61105.1 Taurine dioxygenase, alpha-ketoglutarate-dependent [Streptomyces sp. MnatMP-M17]